LGRVGSAQVSHCQLADKLIVVAAANTAAHDPELAPQRDQLIGSFDPSSSGARSMQSTRD
jgi:hypothetical protein